MNLPIEPPFPPMEAKSVRDLPTGDGWAWEPKWDGFRCIAFRDGDDIELQSKSGRPLARYFPEVVDTVRAIGADRFVLDGEIVLPVDGELSFEHLQLRLHPAESRVRKLAAEIPAILIVFDLLVTPDGESLLERPFTDRRRALESFVKERVDAEAPIHVSPQTTDRDTAQQWLKGIRGGVDGVMAKRMEHPYASGARTAMCKIKRMRSADCVVGGFRYGTKDDFVGSLLLGLYDDDGVLHHVGFTSGLKASEKPALTEKLREYEGPPGFTGRAPGGPSRWSTERSGDWVPLRAELVVEVEFDHYSEGRFRHGTRLLRWRPDKAPEQCTLDQVRKTGQASLDLL
ncbi:MAG TPA: ATP-dependent DNA ligase [Longimicrobiales bacterium]|nr:ATP-dependent DNA ligase [Longimicrobiales bacterium]